MRNMFFKILIFFYMILGFGGTSLHGDLIILLPYYLLTLLPPDPDPGPPGPGGAPGKVIEGGSGRGR